MSTIDDILRRARDAQRALARLPRAARDAALDAVSASLSARRDAVLAANAADVEAATALSTAMRDRLTLTPARFDAMLAALAEVRAMPDPLDAERFVQERPNGLRVYKRRVPLGVIAVVYEARPNVTVEAASLTLRSGNAAVLRGGSEAIRSNAALAEAVREGLARAGLPVDAVTLVTDLDRARVAELMGAVGKVDLLIPRGGDALMAFVDAHAKVPVVRHGQGVCHVYVDAAADAEMASAIALNAKVSRPGVCNAMETLLVHREAAERVLPALGRRFAEAGVELRAGPEAIELLRAAGVPAKHAVEGDWDTEFLGLTLAVRLVGGLDEALAHIAEHGTGHTASVVTADAEVGERFLREVEASCVLWNASTRFNDGGQLGLGAEIGISTTRMHAWGPMSAAELTAEKFVVRGDGQVRV
ncbi:MAG: glutamate-5-semialdehyde dehydrogenase [Polyangiales bacterium]